MKRPVLFLFLVAVVAVLIVLIGRNPPDIEALRGRIAEIGQWRADQPLLVAGLFFLAYVGVTALSLPLAAWMTLAAGALFGFGWGR